VAAPDPTGQPDDGVSTVVPVQVLRKHLFLLHGSQDPRRESTLRVAKGAPDGYAAV
jgi:hypothetical protein